MKNPKEKRQFKRQMRSKPTFAEAIFKSRLEELDLVFKHQMILGWYIPDFVLPEHMLIFELDGNSHKDKEWYDSKRDDFIRKCGFEVIRIPNRNAGTFLLDFLKETQKYPTSTFRSGLGKANSIVGHTLLKQCKREMT